MTLTLTFTAPMNVPVEVEGVMPAALREKSPTEIERLTIHHGNRAEKLADFFTLAGGDADDFLAHGMLAGSIFVIGENGIRPGAEMHRGTIVLLGARSPQLLPSFRYGSRSPLVYARHGHDCCGVQVPCTILGASRRSGCQMTVCGKFGWRSVWGFCRTWVIGCLFQFTEVDDEGSVTRVES